MENLILKEMAEYKKGSFICESIDGELCYFCTPGKPCKKTMFDSENPCIEGKVYITNANPNSKHLLKRRRK
jgi:hypothetical protein